MNTVTVRGMSRDLCALTVTISIFDELVDIGAVTGDVRLSGEGGTVVEELKAAGFEFNEGEMEGWVAYLMSPESGEDLDAETHA